MTVIQGKMQVNHNMEIPYHSPYYGILIKYTIRIGKKIMPKKFLSVLVLLTNT